MLLNCGVGEDSWESLGLQGDPTSPFWRRSALGFLWREWCYSWNSSTLATSCEELTHWKRLWCLEGLKAGGEGDARGWDGWMASLTRLTWVWVNSGSWWWTGRPGVLRFMGLQRVRHNWATELNWMVWFKHETHRLMQNAGEVGKGNFMWIGANLQVACESPIVLVKADFWALPPESDSEGMEWAPIICSSNVFSAVAAADSGLRTTLWESLLESRPQRSPSAMPKSWAFIQEHLGNIRGFSGRQDRAEPPYIWEKCQWKRGRWIGDNLVT